MIGGEKPLQERLAAKVVSQAAQAIAQGRINRQAAQAIAQGRINRQAAHFHDAAELHAIAQSEVFRQVREHLTALDLQGPALHFQQFVDADPRMGPLPDYSPLQYLPHLNLLESAVFDHQYLLQMMRSLEDPEAKLDHLSLKTILEIEERTCDARLKGAEGKTASELEQRRDKARAVLKGLSRAPHRSDFTTATFVTKLAKEVEEHRVNKVFLPARLYDLINQVASIVGRKTKEIKLAVNQKLKNQRPSEGNKPKT